MNFSQLGFGVFSLKIHGIFLALIFGIVSWHYYKKLQREKFPVDFFVHHFWRWVLSGIVVGRLLQLGLDYEIVLRNGVWSLISFWDGELHLLGFSAGFFGWLWHDTKNHQFGWWRWIDAAIVSLLIGVVLQDLSAFITGAIYGSPASFPWAIQYETFGVQTIEPVHPVTIYMLIPHAILLHWAYKHEATFTRIPGKFTVSVLFTLFFIDLIFQFFRGDPTIVFFDMLRIEQVFLLVLLGLCGWQLHQGKFFGTKK